MSDKKVESFHRWHAQTADEFAATEAEIDRLKKHWDTVTVENEKLNQRLKVLQEYYESEIEFECAVVDNPKVYLALWDKEVES